MRARRRLCTLLLALALAPPVHAGAVQDWSFAPLGAHHDGTVCAAPTPDYAKALAQMPPDRKPAGSLDWGVVVVSHEDPPTGVSVFTSVPIVIEDGAR